MFQREKLLKDLEKYNAKYPESPRGKFKGVGNLSKSDLDQVKMRAELYGQHFMRPYGNVAAILEKYGYENL